MRPLWKQTRIIVLVPLLVTLALAGAACGSTAIPGGIGLTPESTNADNVTGSTTGYEGGYEVGQQAPDFVLTLDDGRKATLGSLSTENRPVVLYFFTTW